MGQEIPRTNFEPGDFARFEERLRAETALFADWVRGDRLDRSRYVAGFELEAWLLDRNYFPMPENEAFLARLGNPLCVPELSRFNVELNGTPQPLREGALRRLEHELTATWRDCLRTAHEFGGTLIMIGILPTVRESDLRLDNMSPLKRYSALNERIFKLRGGRPIELDIHGRARLRTAHSDVMLEAATTSFQVHLQVPAQQCVRYFNAAQILSAPMVALSANSPFLFEVPLWDETRIPLFEQAVGMGDDERPEERRVTFGSGYLESAADECFRENAARFPVLLPIGFDDPPDRLQHLRLHNGTIWRWNRLLVGCEAGSVPHVRIEHRVMPAGPTIADMIANSAVYLGASRSLAERRIAPEADLSFTDCRNNFYCAARDGLDAELRWLDGRTVKARELLLDEVLPLARDGLKRSGAGSEEIDRYLGIAVGRTRAVQNGAAWQRAHVDRYGPDFYRLTADYLERQRSAAPVHEWDL